MRERGRGIRRDRGRRHYENAEKMMLSIIYKYN